MQIVSRGTNQFERVQRIRARRVERARRRDGELIRARIPRIDRSFCALKRANGQMFHVEHCSQVFSIQEIWFSIGRPISTNRRCDSGMWMAGCQVHDELLEMLVESSAPTQSIRCPRPASAFADHRSVSLNSPTAREVTTFASILS